MDETSCSLWSPLLNKTWTDNRITLPYQSQRGHSRTIYGAVGGTAADLRWLFSIAHSTNQYNTENFLKQLIFNSGLTTQ